MKKLFSIITLLMLTTITITAQPMRARYTPDFSEFTNMRFYPIERNYFYSENLIEGENVISLGSGYYMAKMDNIPDFVVNFNADSTKAILLGPLFHGKVFTVKFNESGTRITLYKEKPYEGFVYDAKYKVLYPFTSRKYHKRVKKFIRQHPIM